jgi:peptidoglycan/LPS O-acetylase OafA/YrhL
MVIDLQGPISVFRNDPRIYNPVSYLVCGALLLIWSIRTLKLRSSQTEAWFALAAVVPLTMLVTYHHTWDAKLLMLAVPACALLWVESGRTGWIALLLTSAGIVLTADIPLSIFLILVKNLHISTAAISGKMLTGVLMQPVQPILLAMGIFYLWIYVRRDPANVATSAPAEPDEAPFASTLS